MKMMQLSAEEKIFTLYLAVLTKFGSLSLVFFCIISNKL